MIENPSENLITELISETPYYIRHIPNPKVGHYLIAFKKSPYTIKYLNIPEDILQELIQLEPDVKRIRDEKVPVSSSYGTNTVTYGTGNVYSKPQEYNQSIYGDNFEYYNTSYGSGKKKLREMTDENSEEYIREDPFLIKHVTTQTKELCDLAYSLNRTTMKYFESKFITTEMCNEVVKESSKMLSYVPPENIKEMDQDIIINALKENGNLLESIPEPTDQMILAAIDNMPNAIYHVKDKPQWIVMMLASKDPKYFHLVDDIELDMDQTLDLINRYPTFYPKIKNKTQLLTDCAIMKSPQMFQYVPEEFQKEELCKFVVEKIPSMLPYVKNKTKEIYQIALDASPHTLEFIANQTEEMCLSALKRDIRVLDYVNIVTVNILKYVLGEKPDLIDKALHLYPEMIDEEMIISAVKKNGLLLKNIPTDFCTRSVCEEAVKNNPDALEYVPITQRSNYINLLALGKNGNTIRFVDNQTTPLCLIAIRNNANAIRYIKVQTEEVCMLALEKDIMSFEHIRNPTPEMCFYAVNKNPAIMGYINKKGDMYLYALCVLQNPKALYHIRDIDIRNQCKEILEELENIILVQ